MPAGRLLAVARKLSDRGAAAEIRAAVALTTTMPRTLELLREGRITVQRARALVTELEGRDDEVVRAVDAQLAERAAGLPLWRIQQETRRVLVRADPDESARRTAQQNDGRSVSMTPQADDQASVLIYGPAVPITRWYATLDQRARALKTAGDPRTLDQLRFDLAVGTFPCVVHPPPDLATAAAWATTVGGGMARDTAAAAAGLRPSGIEPASADCRMSRPVRAAITVPVDTSLGLSNEPGWLDGYGALSVPQPAAAGRRRAAPGLRAGRDRAADRPGRPGRAPTADLHRVAARADRPGPVRDHVQRDRQPNRGPARPEPTVTRLRRAAGPLRGRTHRHPQSRPQLRARPRHPLPARPDRCVEPGRPRQPHPPAQAPRSDPAAHPTATFWFTPAGQIVQVPRHLQSPPGIDHDHDQLPQLPDPDQLAATDLAQLQPRAHEDERPWLPGLPKDHTSWTWLDDDPPF